MGWPQITYIVLTGLSGGIMLAQHGKPRTGNHSFFVWLLGVAIVLPLLWFGGFFS